MFTVPVNDQITQPVTPFAYFLDNGGFESDFAGLSFLKLRLVVVDSSDKGGVDVPIRYISKLLFPPRQ